MMRCDQCKYWGDDDEEVHSWEAERVGFKLCNAVRERWKIEDEARDGIAWNSDEDGPYMKAQRDALTKARAFVEDGSEYKALLLTGPDFFCALFEERTPEAENK